MSEEGYDSLDAWIASRPPCVQKLAREFPLGTTLMIDGAPHYLVGYTEGDMLIVSQINPYDDWDGAQEAKEYVCAEHLRGPTPETDCEHGK